MKVAAVSFSNFSTNLLDLLACPWPSTQLDIVEGNAYAVLSGDDLQDDQLLSEAIRDATQMLTVRYSSTWGGSWRQPGSRCA